MIEVCFCEKAHFYFTPHLTTHALRGGFVIFLGREIWGW